MLSWQKHIEFVMFVFAHVISGMFILQSLSMIYPHLSSGCVWHSCWLMIFRGGCATQYIGDYHYPLWQPLWPNPYNGMTDGFDPSPLRFIWTFGSSGLPLISSLRQMMINQRIDWMRRYLTFNPGSWVTAEYFFSDLWHPVDLSVKFTNGAASIAMREYHYNSLYITPILICPHNST